MKKSRATQVCSGNGNVQIASGIGIVQAGGKFHGLVNQTGNVSNCISGVIKGSGVPKVETREFPGATKLTVATCPDVTVVCGESPSLAITADDNILPLIETETAGEHLFIDVKGSFQTNNPIHVRVTTPRMESVRICGSGDVDIEGAKGPALSLNISGSGDLCVSGDVESLVAEVIGSGDIDARELKTESADVTVQGSGDVRVYVSLRVSATIIGSGDVSVYGNPPHFREKCLGSGRVRRK